MYFWFFEKEKQEIELVVLDGAEFPTKHVIGQLLQMFYNVLRYVT